MIQTADALGLILRWHGLRLVAGDASGLMPAIRPCFTKRFHAKADQRLFVLSLPGAELTLHASVHGAHRAERQMLFEALSCLRPDDVLILDRGYAAPCLQRLLPRLVLGLGCLKRLLDKASELPGANSHQQVPDHKQPRPKNHVKPHPNLTYKGRHGLNLGGLALALA